MGLVVDFDGTIAEIAPTPDEARVSPGCAEVLGRLAGRLALVAVASGRSASDVSEKVRLGNVVYVGNHGAEYIAEGRLSVVPGVAEYCGRIGGVFQHLKRAADGPGLIWQDKGLTASVHYRLAPDTDVAKQRLADALDSAPGAGALEIFWGKLVLELRPPVGIDKGFAIRKLAQEHELDGVIFRGDDATDVDALRALRDMTSRDTLHGLGIAVAYEDSPGALLDMADYQLDGVSQVEAFLRWLDSATG